MSAKLVIVGDSAFAEVAKEYFDHDSEHEVVGFSVESDHIRKSELHGLPVVPFEDLENHFPPDSHEVFVAIVYSQLNRLRTRLFQAAKMKGYRMASYVSTSAFLWNRENLGEHCFIFEDNTVQPFVSIGDNVILWSGNHIGHHTSIQDNCFISSQVVVSGFCEIGANSFLGVNSTIGDGVTVGRDNWIGPGIVLARDTEPGQLFGSPESEPSRVSTYRFFRVKG